MILSEKDIRVSMKDVTTNWHEGKLSKHPEADETVEFNQMSEEEKIEENLKKCQEEYENK
jgi:hypothetical protein